MSKNIKANIKDRLDTAIKYQRDKDKDLLRVLLGEIQLQETRSNITIDNDGCIKIIKKLIKSNNICLNHKNDNDLVRQNKILNEFLPQIMSKTQIGYMLENYDPIKLAPNKGAAIKEATKLLADYTNYSIDMKMVVNVIDVVRGDKA